jgi:glycosyltransferase involved in cell wall biosynthesis
VHPSLEEGLSMVIPQLLSSGVPVVATTNTGAMDIIENNETGFIIPIRSPKDIAEKIHFLYNNQDFLYKMKEKAAISVMKGFSWDHYGNRYVDFLNKLPN